jgi:hypothetical protein
MAESGANDAYLLLLTQEHENQLRNGRQIKHSNGCCPIIEWYSDYELSDFHFGRTPLFTSGELKFHRDLREHLLLSFS